MNTKIIQGIEFQAVKMLKPRQHWLAKVVKTGFIYPSGIFSSESRLKMWDSIEYLSKRLGAERFSKEILEAK